MICHDDWMNNTIPDKSINLIIADPPYFEVKGEFDFIWASFDAYLQDVERWAKECKRVLADNGSLFWYGDRKKIAYTQIILDKYFNLENNIYWQKAEKSQMEIFDSLRSFYCRGYERILFYSNEIEYTGVENIMNDPNLFQSIKKYLWDEYDKSNLTLKKANKLMNLATTGANLAGEMFGRNRDRFCFPTEEKYELLQKSGFFQKQYAELFKEYKELRQEYENTLRPFDNYLNLSDYWFFTNDRNEYNHETKKPIKMSKHMIQITTRKGDLVLIPFGGSGTDVEACIETGREYICYEIKKKHYDTIKKREYKALLQPELI